MTYTSGMVGRAALRTLPGALGSIAAVLVSFGAMDALCARLGVDPSPAILAAALSVGLMRNPERLGARALLTKIVVLPLIALAAGLVGLAIVAVPALGAALFAGSIALSIWLRNFSERATAVGRTIALPFIAILVAPLRPDAAHGRWTSALLLLAAGAAALVSTTIVAGLAARFGMAAEPRPARLARPRPVRAGELPAATRMALQMLAALGLAFAIGMLAFRAHWSWVVLTAFIVCSGAAGRGDAFYKGLLRLGGAIGGTLAAALVAQIAFPNPVAYAAAVFFVLFVGLWLRPLNYAYWAACATLIFALLQGSHGAAIAPLFAMRVLCMFIGALCGVAATWFVYPIRTEHVVRRRIADVLAALRDVLAGTPEGPAHESRLAVLERHAAELKRVEPPVRLHRAVFGAKRPDEDPAAWIDLTHALLAQARTPGFDRAHLGAEMRRLRAMLQFDTLPSVSKESASKGAALKQGAPETPER
jgi:hypothetical protein